MRNRGFSLVELVVALALLGVVATSLVSVFVSGLRTYRRQTELAHVRANLRQAMATLTREFRGLDAADPLGSDILEMTSRSITYRAQRSSYFVCATPQTSASALAVWNDPRAELRRIEPGRDSLLLFAENAVSTGDDDVWLSAGVRTVTTGAICPGGKPGLRLELDGIAADELAAVTRGAAVRGFQPTQILSYRDAGGRYWVGLREWRLESGWSVTQPVLGPVARNGLRFEYFSASGGIADAPADVARIGVTVVAVANTSAPSIASVPEFTTDSLEFQVGLRNNASGG